MAALDSGALKTTERKAKTASQLRRRLSLPLLSLYGIGVTIGAGIYVLVGKVAVDTGMHAPLSFVIAAVLAGFTAFSYAELGARVPKSAGEAMFVQSAFLIPAFATLIGFMVMTTGIVSSGAIVIGFVGYLQQLVQLPAPITIVFVVALLAGIAAWGIGESVMLAAIVTLVEIAGLLLVIGAGLMTGGQIVEAVPDVIAPVGWNDWSAILSGAVLAFFAFVGFEDIINVAEEAKDPVRTVPRATIITLVVSSSLYFLVALVAVAVVPLDQLGLSEAPLALVFETATGRSTEMISLIAIFAVLNGVMIQMIMSSRILYGIARENWIPSAFAYVHPVTRTPVVATAVVAVAVALLALTLPILRLAEMTSYLVLTVFTIVNLALVRIKLRDTDPSPHHLSVGLWVPVTGAVASLGILLFDLFLA
ncbi:MAG: amino acid permease [Pseudomonadota bacterium]